MKKTFYLVFIFSAISYLWVEAQHSVARQWNEQVLESIRNDFARPTVHARNLFHTSVAMYDAWAAFEPGADTYLLGKTIHGFTTSYQPVLSPTDLRAAQEEAMSYAVFRLIEYRFRNSLLSATINFEAEELMRQLGYDPSISSTEYHCGTAQLGNYLAAQIIAFGHQDNSNDENDYESLFYQPANPSLGIEFNGNPFISDMNRWQPIEFQQFIDQSGNVIGAGTPDFIGPEWGSVTPFALTEAEQKINIRDGNPYTIYYDPGPPAYLQENGPTGLDNYYKWGNMMVAVWSGHLDAADTTIWDISPGAIGNISEYPMTLAEYPDFYNFMNGGDNGTGHAINPKTNNSYEPNLVRRGDYARVLAEFWADGPDSETPPGHWFTILNTVNDHPLLEKRFTGQGEILDDLEWDVKSYFILGGAMHDCAVVAWGLKGWYDYIRPVSAIRGMAEYGHAGDPSAFGYHPFGIPIIPGFSEIIEIGDPLAGEAGQYVGKVKIKTWKGPNNITDPDTQQVGVGWIRALDWWPYQRPSFVTPPFAGYVSGHSTYSRAAAEVLTALTGDPFFPGGVGEFVGPRNEFLVFEEGPSETIRLQWATYRDASDQCSLSRIWGGIHPPVDDIPGRLIGEKIGIQSFDFALPYFDAPIETPTPTETVHVFPNPTTCGIFIPYDFEGNLPVQIYQMDGRLVQETSLDFTNQAAYLEINDLQLGIYVVMVRDRSGNILVKEQVLVN